MKIDKYYKDFHFRYEEDKFHYFVETIPHDIRKNPEKYKNKEEAFGPNCLRSLSGGVRAWIMPKIISENWQTLQGLSGTKKTSFIILSSPPKKGGLFTDLWADKREEMGVSPAWRSGRWHLVLGQ